MNTRFSVSSGKKTEKMNTSPIVCSVSIQLYLVSCQQISCLFLKGKTAEQLNHLADSVGALLILEGII